MSNDEAKKKILARRARFVAAALASVGVSVGCEKPQPCLSPRYVEQDASREEPDAEPMPCLSPVYVPPAEAEATDAGEPPADAAPLPCLAPRVDPQPDPRPRPCLSVTPPKPPKVPQKQ